jgi:hypothetical protein
MKKVLIKIWDIVTNFIDSVLYDLFGGSRYRKRRDIWKTNKK